MVEAEEFKVFLGRQITKGREAAGLSKRALAKHLGISQPAIKQFEGAESWPSVFTLRQLAETLDVSLDWLCGRSAADDQSVMLMEFVAERIAEALRRQGQFESLAGVARMMGFDEQRWAAIGAGNIVPTISELLAIADGTGAPLDWLLGHRNTWEEPAPAPSLNDDVMRLFRQMHQQLGPERVDSLLRDLPEPARTALGRHWDTMKRVGAPSQRRAQRLKAVGEISAPPSEPIPLRAEASHLPVKGGEREMQDDYDAWLLRELARTQAVVGALVESAGLTGAGWKMVLSRHEAQVAQR